jgi:hypothetical protein
MNLDPKISLKFHKGEIKNNVLILKPQGVSGWEQQNKKEGL